MLYGAVPVWWCTSISLPADENELPRMSKKLGAFGLGALGRLESPEDWERLGLARLGYIGQVDKVRRFIGIKVRALCINNRYKAVSEVV